MVYHQYMTELTYLLFLKLAEETGAEAALPEGCTWRDLMSFSRDEQLGEYRKMLTRLGEDAQSEMVRHIFSFPTTVFTNSANLRIVASGIDELRWSSANRDQFGDIYEGLLEKNAVESKSGAGQYFTPRPLIDSIIAVSKPKAGEIVQDPAAGTGGFLTSAFRYAYPDHSGRLSTAREYQGVELVKDTYRLCLMNLFMHGIDGTIINGDALSGDYLQLESPDLVLTNPPFGAKGSGGRATRTDLPFPTKNKQFAFLQHVYLCLKAGGRAAIVVPDNVLFEEGVGAKIRSDLLEKCDLHTILRLPTGIFYAQGVKTNVLFFTRGLKETGNTREVWVYDLRTNMPSYGKRAPLTRDDFAGFESAFGDDSFGASPRLDQGANGRFRRFSRAEIRERGDNLDLSWLRDENKSRPEDLPAPQEILAEITARLQEALAEIEDLVAPLSGEEPLA